MPLIISKYTFRLCNLCVFYLVYLFLGYRGRACERPLTTTFDGYWCNCCFCKIILWVFLDQIKVRRLPWDVDCYSHIISKAMFFFTSDENRKCPTIFIKFQNLFIKVIANILIKCRNICNANQILRYQIIYMSL